MTNFERIKEMSVEELIEYTIHNYKCDRCSYHNKCCNGDCHSGIKEWLNSEITP